MLSSEYIDHLNCVFHLTLAESIDSIKREGLVPRSIETRKNSKFETKAQICLSIPKARVKWLEQMQSRYPRKKIAILKIDPKHLASLRCDLDYSSEETDFHISKLKSDEFSRIVNESGDFVCLDTIPPSAISIDEII